MLKAGSLYRLPVTQATNNHLPSAANDKFSSLITGRNTAISASQSGNLMYRPLQAESTVNYYRRPRYITGSVRGQEYGSGRNLFRLTNTP